MRDLCLAKIARALRGLPVRSSPTQGADGVRQRKDCFRPGRSSGRILLDKTGPLRGRANMTIQEAIYICLICGTFTFALTVGSIALYETHKMQKRLEETVKKIKDAERKLKELRENDG